METTLRVQHSILQTMCFGLMLASAVSAAPSDSSRAALNAIFSEEVLRDNVHKIRMTTARLDQEARFQVLKRWVFPDSDHSTLRMNGAFAAAAPLVSSESDRSGTIVAPVFDLIAVAKELGNLDELKMSATALYDTTKLSLSDRKVAVIQQAAFRFLIAVAEDDQNASQTAMEEILSRVESFEDADISEHWPVLLVLSRAVTMPNFEFLTTELVVKYGNAVRQHVDDPAMDIFLDHVRWLDGLHIFCTAHNGDANAFTVETTTKNWIRSGYRDANTQAQGRPNAHWQLTNGGIQKLGGHEVDYLSFRPPLTGNYQVECDVSVANGEVGTMMVAGTHIQPIDGGTKIKTGNFRRPASVEALPRPLSRLTYWVRYRAVIKDQKLTVFLNGNAVKTCDLPADHNPWVAIRAWRRARCKVRDLRISGTPVIPETVSLIVDENLNGWAPNFGERFGRGWGSWQALTSGDSVSIISPIRPELTGTYAERLLTYQRPMSEDGSIKYDFFYRAGDIHVHPALGRLCFLLNTDGVRLHWLTNGNLDKTPMESGVALVVEEDRRGPARLPLLENEWNRLKLELRDSTIQLTLNGQLVYEHTVAPDNPRTFGLFHFSDQTQARVRNVIWRGDWPRQIPAVAEQQLRDPLFDELSERSKELRAVFEHDFRRGRSVRFLDFMGDEGSIKQQADGVFISRSGRNGVHDGRLTFGVKGDFDFEVQFRGLSTASQVDKSVGCGLLIYFEGESRDEVALFRRTQKPNVEHRLAYAHKFVRPDGKKSYSGGDIPEESLSGRLRLSRRGKTFFALYAEEDSPNFRLVNQREVTGEPSLANGIRIVMQAEGNSTSALVLQKLSLRAEEFVGTLPEPEVEREIVGRLNVRRETLDTTLIDYASPETFAEKLTGALTPEESVMFDARGMRVTSVGRSSSRIVDQRSSFSLKNCVDIEASLDVHRMDAHTTGSYHSKAALICRMQSDSVQSAVLTLIQLQDGTREVVAQLTELRAGEKLAHRQIRSLRVQTTTHLRIAMHEGKLCFLYSEAGPQQYRILAEVPLLTPVQMEEVVQRTQALGSGHRVEVTWKSLSAFFSEAKQEIVPAIQE